MHCLDPAFFAGLNVGAVDMPVAPGVGVVSGNQSGNALWSMSPALRAPPDLRKTHCPTDSVPSEGSSVWKTFLAGLVRFGGNVGKPLRAMTTCCANSAVT